MPVVTCEKCEREKCKTMVDGLQVCSFCQRHRAECEARFVLSMPRRLDRQQYLESITSRRGPAAGKELKDLVMTIWKAKNGEA